MAVHAELAREGNDPQHGALSTLLIKPSSSMQVAILAFWFEQCRPQQWFRRSESFDLEVRQRFGSLVEQAMAG